jgi:hypothetical protein
MTAHVGVDHMVAMFSKVVNEWFDRDGGHFRLIGDELWTDGVKPDGYYWALAQYEDILDQALARVSESV